ncbi:MAG: Trm112 family protein [Gammaproteobacteria bacterium]
MAIDSRLLDILVCPATRVPVKPLPKDKLATLNRYVGNGEVSYVSGKPVAETLGEALITTDGKLIYRVDEGIPVMLEDHGIQARQIAGW